ncbi:hypothetical protein ACFQX6_53830 [Streptosporangium lutulentum]
MRAIVGADRTEADPDGVAELARLCGNLPLAMRIAGNRLQSQPGWTISQLAGRLKDEERRLEALAVGDLAVATAFALSYQQLSGTARLAFRRLALAAAPDFGVPVAAVLTKADLFETEDALETLVELGLLTSPYTGRYVFHDLVRLFARAQLEQEESIEAQQEARRRMESWLLEVAVVAGRWFDSDYGAPPPEWRSLVTLDSEQEASDWLRAEETAWLEALRSAAQRGEHAAVVEVAVSLGWFADIWKRWEHWREVFELSSHAARAMGDRLQEAVLLNHLSEVLTVCEGRREEGRRPRCGRWSWPVRSATYASKDARCCMPAGPSGVIRRTWSVSWTTDGEPLISSCKPGTCRDTPRPWRATSPRCAWRAGSRRH